jgi:hypothetical protein
MALSDGYGVLIGTKSNYYRDPPDDYGRYYHGNLFIHAPAGDYHCAIDVDPKFMPDGIQWRIVSIRSTDFTNIKAKPNGCAGYRAIGDVPRIYGLQNSNYFDAWLTCLEKPVLTPLERCTISSGLFGIALKELLTDGK